jgi:predicted kinase
MPLADARRAIFVISGTQGAGKTTVAQLLAERFDRAAHLSGDALQKMIISGRQWPVATQTTVNTDLEGEAVRQLRLRLHNACLLARSFFDAGFTAVLDDIVIGDRLAEVRAEFADLPFMFVMLTPNLEAVREHERQRGSELWREWEWLTESVFEITPRIGLWLDNSNQTPEHTVDDIMRRAWTEAVITADAVSSRSR